MNWWGLLTGPAIWLMFVGGSFLLFWLTTLIWPVHPSPPGRPPTVRIRDTHVLADPGVRVIDERKFDPIPPWTLAGGVVYVTAAGVRPEVPPCSE